MTQWRRQIFFSLLLDLFTISRILWFEINSLHLFLILFCLFAFTRKSFQIWLKSPTMSSKTMLYKLSVHSLSFFCDVFINTSLRQVFSVTTKFHLLSLTQVFLPTDWRIDLKSRNDNVSLSLSFPRVNTSHRVCVCYYYCRCFYWKVKQHQWEKKSLCKRVDSSENAFSSSFSFQMVEKWNDVCECTMISSVTIALSVAN